MAYKLIDVAPARSRAVNAPHLVDFVRGAVFPKGRPLERPVRRHPHRVRRSSRNGGRLNNPIPSVENSSLSTPYGRKV